MAIFARITFPNLGFPITYGALRLVDGTATEPDAFVGYDSADRIVLLSREDPTGTLGHLSHDVSSSDLIINSSSATEDSLINYMILGPGD